jgi:hypothetical protein
MQLKSFDEFEINEGRSTIVPDNAFFSLVFLGTWTSVKFGLNKERGVAFKYYGHPETKWWWERKSTYALLEDSAKLILIVLGLEDRKIERNMTSQRSGFKSNSDPFHTEKEIKMKFVSGDMNNFSLGMFGIKMVEAYKKATGFEGSIHNFRDPMTTDLKFSFEGNKEDLKRQLQIFNEELHKEFKTVLTSQKFGL